MRVSTQHLTDTEQRAFAAIFKTVNPKLFPANFDENLTNLRHVMGHCAMGWEYRLPRQLAVNGKSALQLREEEGATAAEMKEYGFSAKELKEDARYGSRELVLAGLSAKELHDVGVGVGDIVTTITENATSRADAADLVKPATLRAAGYSAKELAAAAFSAVAVAQGGYTEDELILAGFPASQVAPLYRRFRPTTR